MLRFVIAFKRIGEGGGGNDKHIPNDSYIRNQYDIIITRRLFCIFAGDVNVVTRTNESGGNQSSSFDTNHRASKTYSCHIIVRVSSSFSFSVPGAQPVKSFAVFFVRVVAVTISSKTRVRDCAAVEKN
jgi:hypothetical protein